MSRKTGLAVAVGLLGLAPLALSQDGYEIGPKDILKIAVKGQTALSDDFVVDAEGMLNLPMLGRVKASEMTPVDLEKKLATLLADGFVKRPEVQINVKEYISKRVFVTGEVAKPGTYPLKADSTLQALVIDLGGPSSNAGHQVVVIRPPAGAEPAPAIQPGEIPSDQDSSAPAPALSSGEPQTFKVSLQRAMLGEAEHNIRLQHGDTVYFPPPRKVYLSGQVTRPGSYKYQEGLTVLQALALGGGVTARGAAGRVKIARDVEEAGEKKRKEFKAKMTDPVLPDDTLIVPERFF